MPDHDLERLSALIFIDGRIIRDIQRGSVFFSPEKLLYFVFPVRIIFELPKLFRAFNIVLTF